MNLLVTGASGFLGRYVVAELLRRGHSVQAVVRPTADLSDLSWQNDPTLKMVRLDLTQPAGLAEALQGVDAVVHLAAAKTGDWQTQMLGTVTATENLLQAMSQAGIQRLVAISTFSVYDYLHLTEGAVLNETAPLEANPTQRDAYAQVKLKQEQRIREFAQQGFAQQESAQQGFAQQEFAQQESAQRGGQVTILRPGMIYGRDALWNACLGAKKGNLWLRIGRDATMPLTYVENCAAAIAQAVECSAAIGQTINIVDDHLPSQSLYATKLLSHLSANPRTIVIDWQVMQLLSHLAWQTNRLLFAGRLKLPGLLIPARLHARFKPLQYSNALAKQILDWTPQYNLEQALDRSCGSADLLAVQPIEPPGYSPI